MLSTENPPPDLQCPSEISQLKSSNDERSCDGNQHNQVEVDLFKSGLDDTTTTQFPKFSIRDYVSNTRSKDVKNNWPFSLKNLQLCLKHGLKDVLPPFQSLDSVRNPLILKCAEDTKNTDFSGSEEDRVFPSTTTSQSCSDINSVPQVKNPILEPEADYLPGSSSKKIAVWASNKVKSNIQNPAKKCKLILKLKNIAEPNPAEDLSANNSVVSDTMATKVCPVCKTFSSSSNTTLNAHIDQCLSGESSVKWMTNSKAIKHRIKPRKTRLMVEIYETALNCTLEDLDRRNGTNWASNLGFSDQELQSCVDEKDKAANVEVNNQEGAVYIDSHGTKLRILSKLSDLPSNPGQTNLTKRDNGIKLVSNKKKKSDVQKHKVMNSLPHAQRSSPRLHFEADIGQQKDFPPKGYKDDDLMQSVAGRDQMNSDGMGMIKQWVGSKRSGLKKKINTAPENRLPEKIGKKSLQERRSSSMSSVSCDESNKRKANLLSDGCLEPPNASNKKKSLPDCDDDDDDRTRRVFSKPNAKQSRKDNPLFHQSSIDLPNGTENHGFCQKNKKVVISISPTVNEGSPFISSRSIKHGGSKKFSSLKKKLLSVRHTSVPESKKKLGRKHSGFKDLRLQCHSRSEEKAIQLRSEQENPVGKLGENATQSEKAFAKSTIDEARVSKFQKKREKFINTIERDISSDSEASPESDSCGLDKNNDSFAGGDVSNVLEEDRTPDEFAYEPSYKIASGETFSAFSKSLETAFPGLKYPSDDGYIPQPYNEAYNRHCLTQPSLGREQNKIGDDLITSSGHAIVEMDVNEAQGNYFVDVDPIPIPGPPGSFLPSPGRMSSEELQGNSSLTACMIQSSENEHEMVGMDSSDSPISVASVVSDSVTIKQSHGETQRDISGGRIEPAGEGKNSKLHESKSNSTFPDEMIAHRFKNSPLCCCSRRDGALLGNCLINPQQQFVVHERKIPDDTKEKAHYFNPLSDALPAKNSPIRCAPVVVSQPSEFKSSIHSDCESPSPSTSNPVLRLMGKNLMVVNKDEKVSPQTWRTQSSMVVNQLGPRLPIVNQEELYSFQPSLSPGSSVFVNMSTQSFNFNQYDGFNIPANIRPPPSPSAHPSTVMFSSKNFVGNFLPSLKRREYVIENIRSPVIPNSSRSSSMHKEVIVIDDSAENEVINRNMKFGESAAGTPNGPQRNSRRTNPLYNYPAESYPVAAPNRNAQVPPRMYFSPGFS